ncbi:uncharacterized protein LOC133805677 [Humulus lupulus]|uniref:uncharacterized protein LOC133805677 n=1 Tax=Humulus lupulus TaxID=3486 RepID=UPI002B40254C|nr:uncharacterized protein LOC133805677 [Humulus lupulus]
MVSIRPEASSLTNVRQQPNESLKGYHTRFNLEVARARDVDDSGHLMVVQAVLIFFLLFPFLSPKPLLLLLPFSFLFFPSFSLQTSHGHNQLDHRRSAISDTPGAAASLTGVDGNPKVWWPSEQGRAYTATPKFRRRNFEVTFRRTQTTVWRVGGAVGISIMRGSSPTKSFRSTHHFSSARFWVSSPLWKHFPVTPEVIWAKELYFRDVLVGMIVLIYAMHIFVDVSGTVTNSYCAPLGKNVILKSD